MASAGNDGCPCIDEIQALSSLTDRSCTTADGQDGVMASARAGACFPLSYGSNTCLQHDLFDDPACDITNVAESDFPAYCIRTWCYVDMKSCVRLSEERVLRSDYFDEVDVFYSYSTCNSTADDWIESKGNANLGGIALEAIVPSYMIPMIYKTDGGEIISPAGDEYYNNSVPYEGIYVNYINEILRIANGDVQNISYTHRSRASSNLHPTSTYTAAVQDIADGLADMGVAPFWMTGERLKMTAFTVPTHYDKTVLVIPKPGEKQGLMYQTAKVFGPFTPGLWALLVAVIVLTALLSVWFQDTGKLIKGKKWLMRKKDMQKHKNMYARLALDAILQKGNYFFSAGVEQDPGSSLPHKLLMFGFGFFILVSVSAYVANLAAFLTMSVPDYIGTMEGMVENGMRICGHPALKSQLENKWPSAKFIYSDSGKEYYGLLDDYDAGKCDAMAVGRGSSEMDLTLLDLYCERGLVFTESLVVENPVAFPIKPELAAGLSYWIVQGEKYHGVSLQKSKEEYNALNKWEASCNVELSEQDEEQNDYTKIAPLNMFFPLIFWATFSIIAIILQLLHARIKRKGGRSSTMLGRQSTWQLKTSMTAPPAQKNDEGDEAMLNVPTQKRMGTNGKTDSDHESQLPQSITNTKPTLKDHTASDSESEDLNIIGDQRPSWMGSIATLGESEDVHIDDGEKPTWKDNTESDGESEVSHVDDFHENDSAISTTRKRMSFNVRHDVSPSNSEDYIRNRIQRLVDDCVLEIKKQKEA